MRPYLTSPELLLNGIPEEGVNLLVMPLWDIPETINLTLEALSKKKVNYAVVIVPTSHKIVRRKDAKSRG